MNALLTSNALDINFVNPVMNAIVLKASASGNNLTEGHVGVEVLQPFHKTTTLALTLVEKTEKCSPNGI